MPPAGPQNRMLLAPEGTGSIGFPGQRKAGGRRKREAEQQGSAGQANRRAERQKD